MTPTPLQRNKKVVCRRIGTEQYFVDFITPTFSKDLLKELGVFGKRVEVPTNGTYVADKAWEFHWKKGSIDKLKAMKIYV